MATYTSNLNLYMPDSTDDFGEFREEHNDNMVKIDNAIGGGGGSGGHTIVNENGTDMPAEGKLQFTGNVNVTDDSGNGKTVVDILGGGGNVYGAFIDTNRLLASGNIPQGSSTYTAAEDCALLFTILSDSNNSAKIEIDGVKVWEQYDQNGINSFANFLLVRSGQTVTFTQSYSSNGSYKAYGLTQGTNGIFTPIIYSDNERVVGVWRDNKPLYQITIDLGSDRTFSSGWQSFANKADYPDYEYMSAGMLFASSGVCTHVDLAHNNSTYLELRPKANAGGRYLTYQYTKTTDVAGSGNWNTDGVPTVHYSTSEQVIGTWLGKPLYQRTWDFVSTNIINANTWTNLFSNDIDIDKITMNETLDDEGRSNKVAYCGVRNGYVAVYSTYATNIQTITLRYTKVTD